MLRLQTLINPKGSAYFFPQCFEKRSAMTAIHLHVMKLKGNRQCRLEPTLTVFPPHDHWIAEQVCILVDDAVKFGPDDGRGPDNHTVFKEDTFTVVGRKYRPSMIFLCK